MRKFFLSAVVIVSFIAYSIYHRGQTKAALISPKSTIAIPTDTPTPTPTEVPASQPVISEPQPTATPTPTPTPASGYKDGTYAGSRAFAFYGFIQVQAIIAGGRITDVKFLEAPSDRSTSRYINEQADPILAQEAIQIQSSHVDIVSGATDSSIAFRESLKAALDQAK